MNLYVASNTLIQDPKFAAPITSLSFKRGDSCELVLYFCEGGAILPFNGSREIVLGIKESGQFDGDYLVYADTYTQAGSGYKVTPSFNTTPLNTLLGKDSSPNNDVASLNAMLELTWSDDGSNWQSTQTITATINNDVIGSGIEGLPTTPPNSNDWLEAQRPAPILLSVPPVDSTPDSGTVTQPLTADSFTVTSKVPDGNLYTFVMNSQTTLPTVSHVWTSPYILNIKAGGRAFVVLSGAGSNEVNTIFRYNGEVGGKPSYINDTYLEALLSYNVGNSQYEITYDGTLLYYAPEPIGGSLEDAVWVTSDGIAPGPGVAYQKSNAYDMAIYITVAEDIADKFDISGLADGSSEFTFVQSVTFSGGVVGDYGKPGSLAIVNSTTPWLCISPAYPYRWVELATVLPS